jgi:multidrug efflux system outer membrane protein
MPSLRNRTYLLTALLLAGCAAGPDYRRPEVAAPAAYPGGGAPGARALEDLAWWDVCLDPNLRNLVHGALVNGFDVRIAEARVGQARAVAAEVRGQRLPSVGYVANADRGRNALFGNPYNAGGSTSDGFDGYLSAAWEFDLWGRVRRLDEAAHAAYLASDEGRRAVRLSLVAEVADTYYDLVELDEEHSIAEQATAAFGESLRLFNRRLEGGAGSRLESASAEAALQSSAALVPGIERQAAVLHNRIRVLVGEGPGPVARSRDLSDDALLPDIPAGLPSDLLERRPDVRQAEEVAREANAGIGVTVGGFLPRIGLSAILGGVSPQLDGITSRTAGLWSAGANATGPLFQGGGLRGQYEGAKEAWEEAKLRYQETALGAFSDVANALVARAKLSEERRDQEAAVRALQLEVRLSTERYVAGKASYFEVIQSQELLYPAEVALARVRRDQFEAVVQLYKALGGGWSTADGAWTQAPGR